MANRKLPTQLKIIRGTFKKSRENLNEPAATTPLGEPTADLARDETKLWRDVVTKSAPGVLMESDRYAMEVFVVLHSMFRRREALSASQTAMLMRALCELGLTPVARSKVVVAPAKQAADPFAEFA